MKRSATTDWVVDGALGIGLGVALAVGMLTLRACGWTYHPSADFGLIAAALVVVGVLWSET